MKPAISGSALLAALVLGVGSANASATNAPTVNAFYVAQSDLDVEADGERNNDKGDGLGARLQIPIGEHLRIGAEWQNADLDDTDWIVEQLRGGLSLVGGSSLRFGVGAEFVRLTIETQIGELETKGYNVFARGELDAIESIDFYGQLGYVDFENDDGEGTDFLLGVNVLVTEHIGAFGELHSLSFEDDTSVQIDLTDYRVGIRASF